DVLELARLLTGWSVAGAGEPARLQRMAPADGSDTLRFVFRQPLHEPGSKVVLGERYGTGVAEGERAVRMLCRHPATALFVARRLVTHFVSDTPPDSAVTGIARVFSETRGDLRAVSLALVDLDEAWSADAVKFRTPQDWLVAVLRALGVRQVDERMALMLRQLRHTMWSPAAPKGFGDTVQEWADPDSLMNRAELARTLARRAAPRGVAPHTLLDVADVADDTLRMLLDDASIPADERIALALAGPAFQWR
ncbi:MAG TPA: DUF1800 family protein, partial [Longimicrobiales bacterium]|nr:DUF1800 family protein [Longimicrobiales bacterium]